MYQTVARNLVLFLHFIEVLNIILGIVCRTNPATLTKYIWLDFSSPIQVKV